MNIPGKVDAHPSEREWKDEFSKLCRKMNWTLLAYICENGFEHHVAINLSQTAAVLDEALSKYLGCVPSQGEQLSIKSSTLMEADDAIFFLSAHWCNLLIV